MVRPYIILIACLVEEPDGVLRSGEAEPAYMTIVRLRDTKRKRCNAFLQVNATLGLCIAYLFITSRIREYSSEVFRKAARRVGVLKKRFSI